MVGQLRGWEWLIVIALAAVVIGGAVIIVRRSNRDYAKASGGKTVNGRVPKDPSKPPTARLWWGGILLAYALLMLFNATFNGIQVIALVAGIVLLGLGFQDRRHWQAAQQKTPLPAGWHDDPESPDRLRYYDGAVWTDRVAEKQAGGES